VVYAERIEHSKKPDVFYDIIERMYPGRTRIEMFARGKPRPGWTAWGNEVVEQEEKTPLSGG
jgi:N6-adenosine-specific RNA methylase IME4